MKRTTTLSTLFALLVFAGWTQNSDIQRIVNLPRTQIDQILLDQDLPNTQVFASDFAKNSLGTTSNSTGSLEKVVYFYTAYASSPSFDQKQLDAQRIEKLAAKYPEVLSNRMIEWQLIAQTACKSPEEGNSYFHGFVLKFRPEPTSAQREEELKRLQQFFDDPNSGFDPLEKAVFTKDAISTEAKIEEKPANSEANYPEGNFALFNYFQKSMHGGGQIALQKIDQWVPIQFEVNAKGELGPIQYKGTPEPFIKEEIQRLFDAMPDWVPAQNNGKPIASTVNLDLRVCFSPIVRGMYNRDGKKPEFKQTEVEASKILDKKPNNEALERKDRIEKSNLFQSLKVIVPQEKVAVVMDVTSSMSTHIASLNWWLVNSPDSLNMVHYTFFNDGDQLEDKKKKVGSTGGIYHGKVQRNFTATLMETMRNGTGGDLQENDFEAVLEAIELSPNANSIVLIADNFSEVRDASLLTEIKKRVHVIISGEVTVVRECYLDLAKFTQGDLFVNGSRISLANVVPNGQITIAQTRYVFDGTHFKML